MSAIPLKNQITNWLTSQDYWFQYSGNRLLEGESVTDELVIIMEKLDNLINSCRCNLTTQKLY